MKSKNLFGLIIMLAAAAMLCGCGMPADSVHWKINSSLSGLLDSPAAEAELPEAFVWLLGGGHGEKAMAMVPAGGNFVDRSVPVVGGLVQSLAG